MAEKVRHFIDPINFMKTTFDGLREKRGWDIIVQDASILAGILEPERALVGRLDSEPPTVVWINPKFPRKERAFAYGWSLGMLVVTDNLSFAQTQEKLTLFVSQLPIEINYDEVLENVRHQNKGFQSQAVVFAASLLIDGPKATLREETEGIRVTNSLVRFHSQLHQFPQEQIDSFVGMNPSKWAEDTLSVTLRGRRPHPRRLAL